MKRGAGIPEIPPATASAVLDRHPGEPPLLPESRFRMTNLEISVVLVGPSQAHAGKPLAWLPKAPPP